jgi:segregation and condensation protein B
MLANILIHFSLEQISDLPGLDELKGAGLFDGRLPKGFGIPKPDDAEALTADEDPLDDEPAEDFLVPDTPQETLERDDDPPDEDEA